MAGAVLATMNISGSSPRPWGNASVGFSGATGERFIPTPVGKCPSAKASSTRWAVHPHARGEMFRTSRKPPGADGSSPRPWGNGDVARERLVGTRFIPTPVGKCRAGIPSKPDSPVHPHARGEMPPNRGAGRKPAGSSPRPWGNVPSTAPPSGRPRFIPTPVGK